MRVSADVHDPDYTQRPVKVMLDGEAVEHVISADDEEGVIIALDLETKVEDNKFAVKELRGRVDIVLL